MKEPQWTRILNEIKHHRVVPVVGKELLEVDINGKKGLLYDKVAADLAEKLDVDLPPSEGSSPTLNNVAFAYRDQGGDLLDVSYQVAEILRTIGDSIPDPLRKLAEIRHFNLFISTTPDSLLRVAVDNVRFGGRAQTAEVAYSPMTELADLPDDYSPVSYDTPTVYQIFGNAKLEPDFVVTEDDLLKYVNRLQSHDHRPENLLDILQSRFLAWIGTSYPDWLIRFLLCSAKGEALFVTNSPQGYIADRNTTNAPGLRDFLNRHHAVLYESGDPIGFVDELHGRWIERFGDGVDSNTSVASSRNSGTSFPRNGVFISYASEDQAAAASLGDALASNGIQVWLDKNSLNGGDRWKEVIQNNIESCSMFLPLISRHTQTMERRYFRKEWNLALDDAPARSDSYPFIQPILIDDSDVSAEHIPRKFTELHINRFPDGIPTVEFLDRTKQIIRNLSRQQKRTS